MEKIEVVMVNDGTGTWEAANYDVTVSVNDEITYKGRVEGHNTFYEWCSLLDMFSHQVGECPGKKRIDVPGTNPVQELVIGIDDGKVKSVLVREK